MEISLNSVIKQLRQNNHAEPVSIHELKGGLTNKNFRVEIGEEAYVISFDMGSTAVLGIDREAEYHNARQAFQHGIGPEVILRTPQAIINRFIDGEVLKSGDLATFHKMQLVIETLRRCHQIPVDQAKGTYNVFKTAKQHLSKTQQFRNQFPVHFEQVLNRLGKIQTAFNQQIDIPVLCHNDVVPENMILTPNGLILIDWEYSGVGDHFFDLGMLAAYHNLDETQEQTLITAYFGTSTPSALARLRLMRAMSDLRDATWGMVQAQFSSLEFDYINYSMQRFQCFNQACAKPDFEKQLNLATNKTRLKLPSKE